MRTLWKLMSLVFVSAVLITVAIITQSQKLSPSNEITADDIEQNSTVTIEYFSSSGCGSCKRYEAIVDAIRQNYSEVVVIKKDIRYQENLSEMNVYGLNFPCVVINKEIKIPRENLTYENLETFIINPSGNQQNQKPTAQIAVINPCPAIEGQTIYFSGYGTDDVSIVGYNWSSNIDGFLSGNSTFTKSDLSVGTHTISFSVRDNMGEWSYEVPVILVIKGGE